MKTNINELEALNNACSGTDLKVAIYYQSDTRKKNTYFVQIGSECISPCLDYMNLNHFILGYLKCLKHTQKQTSLNQVDDINELIKLSSSTNVDNYKLDRVYNEVLLPLLKDRASSLKQNYIEIWGNSDYAKSDNLIKELFNNKFTLKSLIETEMKPYLISKGFHVHEISPSYYAKISWKKQ